MIRERERRLLNKTVERKIHAPEVKPSFLIINLKVDE